MQYLEFNPLAIMQTCRHVFFGQKNISAVAERTWRNAPGPGVVSFHNLTQGGVSCLYERFASKTFRRSIANARQLPAYQKIHQDLDVPGKLGSMVSKCVYCNLLMNGNIRFITVFTNHLLNSCNIQVPAETVDAGSILRDSLPGWCSKTLRGCLMVRFPIHSAPLQGSRYINVSEICSPTFEVSTEY